MPPATHLPVVVLISGNGSNLQAIIDETGRGALDIDLRAVISNRSDAYGLVRAQRAGIPAHSIRPRDFADSAHYETALSSMIDRYAPRLLVLAGFMRILGASFVRHYQGRIFNIHPSLLPKYRGLHTHRRVLEAGDAMHGASVHFVTEELDGGPVVVQKGFPVQADDDEQSLARHVQQVEHVIYPEAIRLFAHGRLRMHKGQAEFDGQPMNAPVMLESFSTT